MLVLLAGCTSSTTPPAASTTPTASAAAAPTTVAPTAGAPSAEAILEKAKANAIAATSAAFSGRVQQGGVEMLVDFKGTSDGSTSDITLTTGTEGKARILSVGGQVYIQADERFWTAQGVPSSFPADKFVKVPAAAKEFSDEFSLNGLIDEAFKAVTPSQLSDTVGSEVVNGIDSWVITDSAGQGEGSLHVSKSDYQVVRFTGSSSSPGQLDFAHWNEDLGITAPPKDQVVTLD
ncbi:hypothetical protein IDVR_21450 [Intrasporangium sp. DVR]